MLRLSLLAAMTLAVAAPAAAQDAVDDLFANPRSAEERPQDSEPRPVDPVQADEALVAEEPAPDPQIEEIQRLNAAVAARNRAIRERNAAAEAEYRREMSEHAEWVARLEREHQAERDAHEAEVVRRQQEHEANLAAWRRRVEACRSGVIAACEPSTIR